MARRCFWLGSARQARSSSRKLSTLVDRHFCGPAIFQNLPGVPAPRRGCARQHSGGRLDCAARGASVTEGCMQAQTIGSDRHAGSRAAARPEVLIAAVMAALLGAFLLWGVGFSPIDALHN